MKRLLELIDVVVMVDYGNKLVHRTERSFNFALVMAVKIISC